MTFLSSKTAARRPLPRHVVIVSAAVVIIIITFLILTPRPSGLDLSSITRVVVDDVSAPVSTPSATADPSRDEAYKTKLQPADIDRVSNSSLGFSKIFVVGLPERSDKRDAIALASALTGFHVEWADGVKGEDIPDKAIPFGIERE